MVSLNGQRLDTPATLSARTQAILSMIADGADFLRWSIGNSAAPLLAVPTEADLLVAIQEGVHAEGWLRFRTFRVDIRAAVAVLSEAQAQQLAGVWRTANDTERALAPLLHETGWRGYEALGGAAAFAAAQQSQRPDLFSAPSFSDLLVLADLLQATGGDAANTPAAVFAAGQAASVPDYVHLHRFYAAAALLPDSPQPTEIASLYIRLLSLLPSLLFTPQLTPGGTPDELREALPQLARTRPFIGYLTPTAGTLDLVRNVVPSAIWTQEVLQQAIQDYLTRVRDLVAGMPASAATLTQDGSKTLLRFDSPGLTAVVGVDRAGLVFLQPRLDV